MVVAASACTSNSENTTAAPEPSLSGASVSGTITTAPGNTVSQTNTGTTGASAPTQTGGTNKTANSPTTTTGGIGGSGTSPVAPTSGSPAPGSTSVTGGSSTSGATTAPPQSAAVIKKSISNWVGCTGTADDTENVAQAFAAARHGAFTLVVDCPVLVHSGLDIAKVIYIDDGTTVEFSGSGKFIVDNIMHPAFVIANATGVSLTNWQVEFDGSLPTNPDVGGFSNNGQFIAVAGHDQPAAPWNDVSMTTWLAKNRAIVFDRSAGAVGALWRGPTNTCAVFYITGDTSNLTVTGMNVYAPPTVGGDHFVPVVFQLSPNFKSNQTVNAKTPFTAQYYGLPHNLTFSNITLDGTYMGWVGTLQNAVFEHVQSHRYGDLQDSKGANVGGLGKWFAPPHLFYFAYPTSGDPALGNTNIRINDVTDQGPRIGTARDKGGSDTISGYALSIKIGCNDCSVDNYTSARPDGFIDVLYSNGLTVSNVTATYNSAFINNLYQGWRWPAAPYTNVTFQNISLTDTAVTTSKAPIGNVGVDDGNTNIVLNNVHVTVNRWDGPTELPLPSMLGEGNRVALDFIIAEQGLHIVGLQVGSESLTLQGAAFSLKLDSSTVITWKSLQANSCSASGAWSGAVATTGSQKVTLVNAGSNIFNLNCQDASLASTVTLPILAQ
jgi:hypothetical protein